MPPGHIQVAPDSTGKNIDADSLTSTESGTPTVYRQGAIISDPVAYGSKAQVFPAGELRVQGEALQLFYDPYDAALDTAARWNAPVSGNSAVAASVTAGTLSLATGTVASGYSVLTSTPVFRSSTPGWIRFAFNVNLPDGAAPTSNSYRFWGAAAAQAVPTPANPIANGAGFEVATTGKMYAVVYNGATRTAVQDLSSSGSSTQPLDANPHNYQVFYRPTNIYWYIDGALVASSTLAQSALAVDTLPLCYMAVGFSTPPSPSAVLNSNACSVADTAAGNYTISDPQFGWRRVQVGKSGGLAVRSAQIPSTAVNVAAGNNATVCGPMDVSEAGALTIIAKNQTAATAWAGAPVLVIEQSDDGTSWAPMAAVRADTGLAASTHTLPANAANVEYVFDTACEAVGWARVRITTGPTTNPMTVVIAAGGHAFSPQVTANLATNAPGSRVQMAFATVPAGLTTGATGTEALIVLGQEFRAGASIGTTNATIPITAGKTFRVTGFGIMLKSNGVVATVAATLRYNPTGAATAASAPVATLYAAVPATAGSAQPANANYTDGLDLPGGATPGQFGISIYPVFVTTAPTIYAWITGYEM